VTKFGAVEVLGVLYYDWYITFSNIFDRIGNNVIGLYSFTLEGRAFLGTGIRQARFHLFRCTVRFRFRFDMTAGVATMTLFENNKLEGNNADVACHTMYVWWVP